MVGPTQSVSGIQTTYKNPGILKTIGSDQNHRAHLELSNNCHIF
jgi:hypothetical protein